MQFKFILPAAGYDPENFTGGWKLGNPLSFRTEDGTHLVLKDGLCPADKMPLPGQRPKKPDSLKMLLLQLDEGACASYTVRQVTSPCTPRLTLRAPEGASLRLTAGAESLDIPIPAGSDFTSCAGPVIAPCQEAALQVTCVKGMIQLESVEFGK